MTASGTALMTVKSSNLLKMKSASRQHIFFSTRDAQQSRHGLLTALWQVSPAGLVKERLQFLSRVYFGLLKNFLPGSAETLLSVPELSERCLLCTRAREPPALPVRPVVAKRLGMGNPLHPHGWFCSELPLSKPGHQSVRSSFRQQCRWSQVGSQWLSMLVESMVSWELAQG